MNEPETGNSLPPLLSAIEKYYALVPAACPYGSQHAAVYKQVRFESMTGVSLDTLLEAGYRRNGNIFYTMACMECRACVPVRLNVGELVLNRNQKRTWKRNCDIEVEIAPLQASDENRNLLDSFLTSRYAGRDSTAIDYYSGFFFNTFGCSMEIRYRHHGKLLGVSIVDLSDKAINAVYFYFDPEESKRSPGTYNILFLAELARRYGLCWLYLGYGIKGVSAMNYKTAFRPHYLFVDGRWEKREKEKP